MSPLQQEMARRKARAEAKRERTEDFILAAAQWPGADAHVREVAQQIMDRRNSPK